MPAVGLGQKLRIHLAPTAQGSDTYMQITSEDGFSVNIVLIASEIEIDDKRGGARPACEHCEARDLHGKKS